MPNYGKYNKVDGSHIHCSVQILFLDASSSLKFNRSERSDKEELPLQDV